MVIACQISPLFKVCVWPFLTLQTTYSPPPPPLPLPMHTFGQSQLRSSIPKCNTEFEIFLAFQLSSSYNQSGCVFLSFYFTFSTAFVLFFCLFFLSFRKQIIKLIHYIVLINIKSQSIPLMEYFLQGQFKMGLRANYQSNLLIYPLRPCR